MLKLLINEIYTKYTHQNFLNDFYSLKIYLENQSCLKSSKSRLIMSKSRKMKALSKLCYFSVLGVSNYTSERCGLSFFCGRKFEIRFLNIMEDD